MKKINIAQILKDCPKGMELDCTIFDTKVIYKGIIEIIHDYPIVVQTEHGFEFKLTQYGQIYNFVGAECVIFPKGKTTWEGFVPPCPFKDGDIISDSLGTCIFKGEGVVQGTVDYYCGVHSDYFNVKQKPDGHYGNIVDYRFATEEEKEKLFAAIKANGYKWNPESKTLEKLVEPKFKVGDKVIAPTSHKIHTIESIRWNGNEIYYNTVGEGFNTSYTAKDLQPYKEETMEELRIDFPEGYGYAGIENKQVIFTKIKPQYPKTYEECCEVLSYEPDRQTVTGYDAELIENLQTLKLCRDAYWKIAGDWKYDVNKTEEYFYIVNKCGRIVKEHYMNFNHFLAFPTEEMRDAFYENFKDLIEECKELL